MRAICLSYEHPVPYARGVQIQELLLQKRIADEIPDTVVFMQHEPVVTIGNRGRDGHIRLTEDALRDRGIALAHATRGGDVTYHAPGQLIMYPILKLGAHDADSHGHLFNLEEIAIRTAKDFDVHAFRREGMNGAWTEEGKISAIGFRLKRWVTYHGMSFNVNLDLSGFETIVPCGLEGEPVSSLARILGERCPSVAEVQQRMAASFQDVCGRRLEAGGADLLPVEFLV